MPSEQKTILIVEDDIDSRILLSRALSREGFSPLVARDGIEALKQLESGARIDLVLMDLSMPGMGGAEFVRAVRERPGGERIKILVVSGWDNLAARSKEIGAAGFVRKPVDLETLYREIQAHI